MGLLLSFQNCAPAPSAETTETDDSKIVHKIDSESDLQMLSLFEEGFESDQARNLLKTLPIGVPLAVVVRNGQLYSDVQLIVNGTSFLVSEYLRLLGIFKSENFTVPIFYSPITNKRANRELEVLKELRVDLGESLDSTAYCESLLNKHQDPSETNLLIQIVDASGMLEGTASLPKVYWTLPVQIFNPASCTSN